MILPTTKTKPRSTLSGFTTLLYGRPKLGKSTMASTFPDPVFLDTEGGLGALETYRVGISTWDEFLTACAELAKGDHRFATIVIDTIDQSYARCRDHVLDKMKIKHEADGDYGKAYDMISQEFARVMNRLIHLPYGIVLISHATEKEVSLKTGGRGTIVIPTLPKRPAKVVTALCDFLFYVDIQVEKLQGGVVRETRVIRTRPTATYDAGNRGGLLPDPLPLSYDALERAFIEGARRRDGIFPEEVEKDAPFSSSADSAGTAVDEVAPAPPSPIATQPASAA